jgi:imidazolonepropionase-like amidohydrolase
MASQILFRNMSLLDPKWDEPRGGYEVLVEGDTIKAVSNKPIKAANARVVDCGKRTLMPGLIDSHVHVFLTEVNIRHLENIPLTLMTAKSAELMRGMIDRGFTTVRDTGGADHGLRRAIDAGWIVGPHLIYCGKAISQTGGHGDYRQSAPHNWHADDGYIGHTTRVVDGADNVRKAVREELRRGAGFIKIMASGGGLSPSDALEDVQYSDDEIAAAVDETERYGRYVTAHAHPDVVISRCLELGVRCFEHGTMISDKTAAQVAEQGASVVPTLSIGQAIARHGRDLGFSEAVMRKVASVNALSLESLERLQRSGARTGFGTDLVSGLDHYQYQEFQIRREVWSAADVLRSATSVNAQVVRRREVGRIAEGFVADVIAVQGNPLDVSVFTGDGHNVQLVIKGGEIVKNTL